MNASHWEANITPFKTYSKMFMIKPASKPPRNTRAKLIFPIGILREQSPECRKSKGAEGTVARSLRGAHGTSQEENWKAVTRRQKLENKRQDGDVKSPLQRQEKRDFSLRGPTHSQERMRKKKSACSVRNDGGAFGIGSSGFLECDFGGVAEGEKEN